MTGMIRKALLIAAGFAVVASVASAGVPDPAFSTVGQVAVGTNSGVLTDEPSDPNGNGFNVIVRDVTNAPLNGVLVTLNYTGSGLRLFASQDPGTTIGATGCTISRTTNIAGAVVFGPKSAKFNNGNVIQVSANGVVLGNVKGRSTDIDGNGNVSVADFSQLSACYLNVVAVCPAPRVELDFNNSPPLNGLGDISIMTAEILAGSAIGGPFHTFCP